MLRPTRWIGPHPRDSFAAGAGPARAGATGTTGATGATGAGDWGVARALADSGPVICLDCFLLLCLFVFGGGAFFGGAGSKGCFRREVQQGVEFSFGLLKSGVSLPSYPIKKPLELPSKQESADTYMLLAHETDNTYLYAHIYIYIDIYTYI